MLNQGRPESSRDAPAFLPLPSKHWDYKNEAPCPFFIVVQFFVCLFFNVGWWDWTEVFKKSTDWTNFPASLFCSWSVASETPLTVEPSPWGAGRSQGQPSLAHRSSPVCQSPCPAQTHTSKYLCRRNSELWSQVLETRWPPTPTLTLPYTACPSWGSRRKLSPYLFPSPFSVLPSKADASSATLGILWFPPHEQCR